MNGDSFDPATGKTVTSCPKIGAVVLTYNCIDDLPSSLDALISQRSIEIRIIVVDNASVPTNLAVMEQIFREKLPGGIIVDVADATPDILDTAHAVFIRSPHNSGYSAGNNIGARLAVAIGCEAVLIINPDVRLSDPDYLAALWQGMRGAPTCAVGASRILNLAGVNENPLREITFWEEFLWVRQYLPSFFRPPAYVPEIAGPDPVAVDKLHGCCLMIRASFLEEIGFLDENVFLYSEEPILAAQVRNGAKQMTLFPSLTAVHGHVAATKGNSSRRMLVSIRSRLYYLRRYSGYGPISLAALRLSYNLLLLFHAAKSRRATNRMAGKKRKGTAE